MEGSKPSELNKEVCTITVYGKGGHFAKIDIEFKGESENNEQRISLENGENRMIATIYQKSEVEDFMSGGMDVTETTVKIAKTSNDNETKWEGTVTTIKNGQAEPSINVSIARTGNTDVTHNIEIRYEGQMAILLNEKTTFTNTLEIEKFNEGNYILVNNLSKEQIIQVFNAIVDKINEKTGMDIRDISNPFSDAAEASEEVKKAEATEQVQLDLAGALSEIYATGNSNPTLDNVSVEFQKKGYSVTKNIDGTITVQKDTITATINGNYEVGSVNY